MAVAFAFDVVLGVLPGMVLVSGGARGADVGAEAWARKRGVHCVRVDSLWDYHGPKAGPLRNRVMAGLGLGLLVAFPGGRGTAGMVRECEARRVPVVRV